MTDGSIPVAAAPRAPAPRVGVFDSGVGGLTVLAAVAQALPEAELTYLADAAHNPWGPRSADWVTARCLQLSQHLIEQEAADLILVACNTATTQAIAALRARWPDLPFVGVEPGLKPAVQASPGASVVVLATPGTVASPRMQSLLQEHGVGARVQLLACPGLAEAIEAAMGEAPSAASALQAQLDAVGARLAPLRPDTVVLGCTHYPLVREGLARRCPGVGLWLDTAPAIARRVRQLLPPRPAARPRRPRLQLHTTGRPQALQAAAGRCLSEPFSVARLALPAPDAVPPL